MSCIFNQSCTNQIQKKIPVTCFCFDTIRQEQRLRVLSIIELCKTKSDSTWHVRDLGWHVTLTGAFNGRNDEFNYTNDVDLRGSITSS